MDMRTEQGLWLVCPDEVQKPAARRFLDIVIAAGFIGVADIGRVMAEDEDPLALVLRQVTFKPRGLLGLGWIA